MMDLRNTNYFDVYQDCYSFMKSYMPVLQTDEYWSAVIEASRVIYDKYKDTPENEFVKAQLFCVMDELERIYRKQEAKGGR